MKTIISSIFVLIISILTINCNNTTQKTDYKQLTDRLQFVLDSIVKTDSIPGATFCVLMPNNEIISIASGLADVENKTLMPKDAIMFTGSVGKTFVAATVLKLVEQHKLNLNDKAILYFKDDNWFTKMPNAKDFTIEMLLNHTSGVPDYVYKQELWETLNKNPDKIWNGEERLSFILYNHAVCKAGECWSYADANYIILGMIIEKVSGKTFYDLANEYFIQPLQLKNTKAAISRNIEGLVSGYTGFSKDMLLPEKTSNKGTYAFNPQFEWTGGGFTTTVTDLALWAKALYGENILSDSSKKLMLTPVSLRTDLFGNASYGLGAFIGKTDNITFYGHTGFVPGFSTVMEYIPDYKISISMQFNIDYSKKKKHKIQYFDELKRIVLSM